MIGLTSDVCSLWRIGGHERFEGCEEARDVGGGAHPNGIEIDMPVILSDSVRHIHNVRPIDFGMYGATFIAYSFGGSADSLKQVR